MEITTITGVGISSGTSNGAQPNLSAIVDDSTGRYTEEQRAYAYREREARDSAVIAPAVQQGMATGDSTIPWRAALSLLNSLSSAEQDSPRYRGTRQQILAAIAAGNGPSPVRSGPAGLEAIPEDFAQAKTHEMSGGSIFGKMIYVHQANASNERLAGEALSGAEFGPGINVLTRVAEANSKSFTEKRATAVDYTA